MLFEAKSKRQGIRLSVMYAFVHLTVEVFSDLRQSLFFKSVNYIRISRFYIFTLLYKYSSVAGRKGTILVVRHFGSRKEGGLEGFSCHGSCAYHASQGLPQKGCL